MFKHTVQYVDFNGTERKEDVYFHLSLPEVTRLEARIGKPLDEHIVDLTTNQKLDQLLDFIEKMLLDSYGQKTHDGRSFIKNKTMRDEFEYSQAYAEIFEQLMQNPDLAKKFGEHVAEKNEAKKNQLTPKVVSTTQE